MLKRIKDRLIGARIVLKALRPDVDTAKAIFKAVAENRKHLRPWLVWEKGTKRMEDSFKYLLAEEAGVNAGTMAAYGVYLAGEYIGNIGIFDIHRKNRSAEIGYWLSARFAKNGYMSEAVKLLEKEFFTNGGLNRIQIKCDEKNAASIAVAKKCGYLLEGKLREDTYSEHFKGFRNTLVFSKLKSDFKKVKRSTRQQD